MTFLDFFAGVGGFRRGMELAGHRCVGFCEVDKYAVASYTSMHLITDEQREYLNTLDFKKRQKEILKEEYRNGEWYCDDIRRLRADDVPRADVWCFGFPCQDISVAGKQLGFAGSRSSLFFAVTRVIRDIEEKDRPSVLFIENVKNLLSVNRGLDFAKLLVELDEIGYDCEWSVLNSKHFGVPQNRERVFIIGHLRGRSRREIFPVEGTNGENHVSIIAHRDGYHRNMQTCSTEGITEALDTCQGGGREFHVAQPILFNATEDEVARTIKSQYAKNSAANFIRQDALGATGVLQPILFNANDDNTSKTLMAGYYKYGTATLFGNKGFKGGTTEVGVPFAIDKNASGEEREVANCITSREDRGVANTKQTGTAVAIPIGGINPFNSEGFGNGCICENNSRTLRANKHDASVAFAIPVLTPDRAEKRQNGRRFKEDGEPMFTLTGQDRHGVGIEIEQIDIVQTVKVRKYEVDKEKLIACLRNAKEKVSLNNKTIAEELDLPITKVEHWFRNDSSFAVPDAEVWSDLKQLLKIETDEFDESILTFDEKLNEYDKSNRCYKATGISPTLTSASADEKIAIETNDKKIATVWSDKYQCYIAIRKLTPKECFRLQGWTDDYFEKAEFVNSNSQLYKQAGNGVTVNVIYEIAKKL